MRYILILVKKQEINTASIAEIEQLIEFVKKYDFDFKLYQDILVRTKFNIDESVKLAQREELEQTKKLLNL